MTQGDPQHRAFEAYCEAEGLDNSMHPLHLLYLNDDTKEKLDAFKAGWQAATETIINAINGN